MSCNGHPSFMYKYCSRRLQSCGGDVLVDAGGNAEEGDACRADGEGRTRAAVALERRQRRVGLRDIHGLDDQQVVVE